MAKEVEETDAEVKTYNMLGLSYYSLGVCKSAIMFHQEAFSIAKAIGNNDTERLAYQSLGLNHHSLDKVEKAQKFHHQAYLFICLLVMYFIQVFFE